MFQNAKKNGGRGDVPLKTMKKILLLLLVKTSLILADELVNTTGGVHQLHLASEKWMGCVGNLQLDQRILLTVFPNNGVLCLYRRLAQKGDIIGHVLKNDKPIIFRMNLCFHYSYVLYLNLLGWNVGFEPTTIGTTIRYSNQLS